MKKLTITIMLLISAVFSLNAEMKVLKIRDSEDPYEKPATVILFSDTTTGEKAIVYYGVTWLEEDGSDIANIYIGESIEYAFNLWNMSRDEIESKRHLFKEKVCGLERGRPMLFRYYIYK